MPEDGVKFVAAQMVLALQHLESVGVIHGDIKPQNSLVTLDGIVLLSDFGVASGVGTRPAGGLTAGTPEVHCCRFSLFHVLTLCVLCMLCSLWHQKLFNNNLFLLQPIGGLWV